MSTVIDVADLRAVDLFDDVDDDALQKWAAVAMPEEVEADTVIAEFGEPVTAMTLLLEGTAFAEMPDGDRFEPVGRQEAPTWIGAINALSEEALGVRMRTESACRLARIDAPVFRRLAFEEPAVLRRVLRRVAPVMSRVAAVEQNRERLASLGTMAAGLAHELNNPAAAASRAAAQMTEALDTVNDSYRRFVESGITQAEARELIALADEAVSGRVGRTALDALDAA